MDEVYARYQDNPEVAMFVLYIREAHPGQMQWQDITQPTSPEERMALVSNLCEEDHLLMPILVDGMDNAVGQAYGRLPNSAVIIGKDGIILEKQGWANPEQIDKTLERLLGNEAVSR